ncbi:amidophosphoribosyltransferase [Syntrophorhabdus aromaticivorans]|uniref:Amidophosphoribosyltransferase n=1 Tax=Syntrophorhabdus aromaticivorans TaxID=328301 RepID=A0A971S0E7_9BACT|nr:amidophosphoribosyltransferase [Syntrophorhabdus aromaticivorans]NLW34007.1 amidophosphoribosyltransferase [Syntrophorhabdus aromaticivorans]
MSGIFGIIGKGNAFAEVRTGLENLSHRGQESWGIVSGLRDGSFSEVRRLGSVFQSPPLNRFYFGSVAIGHVRYPTAGETSERNSQPIVGRFRKDKIAVVHNGHIPKYKQLMEEMGGLFQTETDTEVILHMIARSQGSDFLDKVKKTLSLLGRQAAFSVIILHKGSLIAARDPFGFRPLSVARRGEEGDYAWAVASETCAFHGKFDCMGDVEPGEMVVIDGEEARTIPFASPDPHPCSVECLDYASVASQVFSKNNYKFREELGVALAKLEDQKADIIVPIPRAAIPAALGFHDATGIPYKEAISTVGEIGRIFIVSKEKERLEKIEKKFQINREVVKDKEVLLIDTLLVRGSTTMALIPKLREAGARKIHLRLTAPPPRFPCYMGMAMAKTGELLAINRTDEQLTKLIGADTFRYLKVEELRESAGVHFCDACFTGEYPFLNQIQIPHPGSRSLLD